MWPWVICTIKTVFSRLSSSTSSHHLFGHEAKGEDFGQEVAFPTTIQVAEIQGSVVEEKPILRSWRTSWGSSSGLSL